MTISLTFLSHPLSRKKNLLDVKHFLLGSIHPGCNPARHDYYDMFIVVLFKSCTSSINGMRSYGVLSAIPPSVVLSVTRLSFSIAGPYTPPSTGLFCRFAYFFNLFIAVRTVTPACILVGPDLPSLPVKQRYRVPDALSPRFLSQSPTASLSYPKRGPKIAPPAQQVLILFFYRLDLDPDPALNRLALCSIPFNPSLCTYITQSSRIPTGVNLRQWWLSAAVQFSNFTCRRKPFTFKWND